MANSKSTIYPIQLQGAELCLNRYDAEIKQYSGFNKNNSPFVGGCLSNVFTKEEQIEGGNDDNVYIDENGDKYRVDTTGLYKNDTKIIDYTDRDFIDIEKIEVPYVDAIKAYSDKVFLRMNNNEIYLNDKYVGRMPNFSVADFLATYSCGIWYHGKFIFACLCEDLGVSSRYGRIITLEKNVEGEYVLGNVDATFRQANLGYFYETTSSPISIIITNDYYEVVLMNYEIDKRFMCCYVYSGNFNSPDVTLVQHWADHETNTIETASDWAGSGYFIDPEYAKKGETMSFQIYSYPRNEINFRDFGNIMGTGTSVKYALTIKLNAEECQNQFILHGDNVTRYYQGQLANGIPGFKNVYATTKLLRSSIVNYDVNALYTGGSVCFEGPNTDNISTAQNPIGNGAYVRTTKTDAPYAFEVVAGGTRVMDNSIFAVLINNGLVSGIAAYKDRHKILVTDWNTVDESLITYYQDDESDNVNLLYGDYNGNYYLLKKTETPRLKKVYNQIVTNALYNHNSWDIKRNKALCYATGFNFSAPHGYLTERLSDFLNDGYYMAAAINEYNLEDNASILLNPVIYNGIYNMTTRGCEWLAFLRIDRFNISTTDGAIPIYYKSQLWDGYRSLSFIENDMEGLPFPVDTNGNVTYSPNLFSEIKSLYGNDAFIKNGNTFYPLIVGNNTLPVMSFYLASGIDNFEDGFIIQGQFYGIINNGIYGVTYNNGVVSGINFIVNAENLQYVGSTPYEALFYSKTNRCLYSFTGANVLNQKQLVDKISEVRNYLYNPATQTVFLITDIGVLFYGLFGMFLLEYTDITNIFLLDNGIVMSDNNGNYRYIKYYLDEGDTGYEKQNINVETSFYGMNNEMVTINDCLYFRIFSEEHEEGDLKVSATTISLRGRKTEETTFKIKASDWDKITHTIYLRYQPKTQRGLGVSFSIDSPFKIASMSVGSQPEAVLVDKVSKGAINAPSVTTNNNEW